MRRSESVSLLKSKLSGGDGSKGRTQLVKVKMRGELIGKSLRKERLGLS